MIKNKLKYSLLVSLCIFLQSISAAKAGILTDLSTSANTYLIGEHPVYELSKTNVNTSIPVKIGSTTYYFLPEKDSNANILQKLSFTGSNYIVETTEDNALFFIDNSGSRTYYTYNIEAMPTSGYTISTGTPTDYNYIEYNRNIYNSYHGPNYPYSYDLNFDQGYISTINGNFIKNDIISIYNDGGNIGYIKGKFIENVGPSIYNEAGMIISIEGDFINNKTEGTFSKAAIVNDGYIEQINGNFINNYSNKNAATIYNKDGVISELSGIFKNNFTENYTAGAISNGSKLRITSRTRDTEFTNNSILFYGSKMSNAINNSGILYLNAGDYNITINDKIINGGTIEINKTNVERGLSDVVYPTHGTVYINNSLSGGTVNMYNGTLKLGSYDSEVDPEVFSGLGNFDSDVIINLNGGLIDMIDNEARNYVAREINSSGNGGIAIDMPLGISFLICSFTPF